MIAQQCLIISYYYIKLQEKISKIEELYCKERISKKNITNKKQGEIYFEK